jgi:hypothetical protein
MEKDLIVNLADYPEWARTALLILANKNFLAACARAPNLYCRALPLRSHTAHPCRTVRQGHRRSACVSQVRCDVHHLPAEYVRIRPRRLSDISVLHSKSVLHGGLYGYELVRESYGG